MKRCLLFIVYAFFLPFLLQGQDSVFDLFKSRLKLADELYSKGDYNRAISLYKAIERKSPDSLYVRLQIARAFRNLNIPEESLTWYTRVTDSSILNRQDKMNLSDLLLTLNMYDQAQYWISEYERDAPSDSRVRNKRHVIHNTAVYYSDSLSLLVENLPINTEESEFFPYPFKEDILFISSRPGYSLIKNYSNREKSGFFQIYKAQPGDEVTLFSKAISSKYHEGPFSLFADGNTIIFSKSDRKNKKVMLYIADKKDGKWKNIHPLPFNSRKYSVGHPFFNKADSCLYFASDMPGGLGGTDLYKCSYSAGKFGQPENLGEIVNTEGDELYPFIYQGKLAFTSDGHSGLGGKDILFASSSSGTSWNKLENPGYPLNSPSDDFAAYISPNGSGYFSSNRPGGKGKDDLYSFKELRQEIQLKVQESFSSEGISKAKILIKEQEDTTGSLITPPDGLTLLSLKPGKKYTVSISKEGYKKKDTVIVTDSFPAAPLDARLVLDRKNKSYIKGILWTPEEARIANASVKIVNTSTWFIDTVTANEEGEFFAQIDPDYQYMLSTESDTLSGYTHVANQVKKRGSSVSVFDIFTGNEIKITSTIQVIDSVLGQPVPESLVEIRNLITGETRNQVTDEKGECTISTSLLFQYEIAAKCNDYPSERKEVVLEKRDYILILK